MLNIEKNAKIILVQTHQEKITLVTTGTHDETILQGVVEK
jgi:hypothetical protein